MERIQVSGFSHRVDLLGTCQGLEGEAEAVVEAIRTLEPSTVALALDPDLAPRIHDLPPDRELGAEDEAYALGLSEWGEVRLPAPVYPAAVEAAGKIGAELEGVDLPEEEYLERFTSRISVIDLTKRALRVRWAKTRPLRAEDPASYCRRFDERVNKGPFADLERARERAMAARVGELAREGPVAFIVEIQRAEGVRRALEAGVGSKKP